MELSLDVLAAMAAFQTQPSPASLAQLHEVLQGRLIGCTCKLSMCLRCHKARYNMHDQHGPGF